MNIWFDAAIASSILSENKKLITIEITGIFGIHKYVRSKEMSVQRVSNMCLCLKRVAIIRQIYFCFRSIQIAVAFPLNTPSLNDKGKTRLGPPSKDGLSAFYAKGMARICPCGADSVTRNVSSSLGAYNGLTRHSTCSLTHYRPEAWGRGEVLPMMGAGHGNKSKITGAEEHRYLKECEQNNKPIGFCKIT